MSYFGRNTLFPRSFYFTKSSAGLSATLLGQTAQTLLVFVANRCLLSHPFPFRRCERKYDFCRYRLNGGCFSIFIYVCHYPSSSNKVARCQFNLSNQHYVKQTFNDYFVMFHLHILDTCLPNMNSFSQTFGRFLEIGFHQFST